MLRTLLTFSSDMSDDGQWDAKGNVILPPGRLHSELFADLLSQRYTMILPPWNEEDYGWEFLCRAEGFPVSVLLQSGERWLITVIPASVFGFLRPSRRRKALQAVCAAFDEIMRRDPRFHDLQWFTHGEYDNQGVRKQGR